VVLKRLAKKAADSLIDHASCTCNGNNYGSSFEKRVVLLFRSWYRFQLFFDMLS